MTTNSINNTVPNDFTVTKSAASSIVVSTTEHLTDAANSQACQIISVAGSSSDDPYTRLSIGTTTTYALGIDNSDSDKFKITYHADSATPSSTALLTSTIAGEINKPLQTTFLAQNASVANVTGDGTTYTLPFGLADIFNVGSSLSGGVFTAPVTGKYFLGSTIALQDVTQDGLKYYTSIVTSNRSYYGAYCRMSTIATASDTDYLSLQSILADMDAADTCTITMNASGGTKTYNVGSQLGCYFYGDLVI